MTQKHTFRYQYGDQTIPFDVWTTGNTHIGTILFLGTVQIGKLPGWVAESAPENTAIVQGMPHWLAKADGSDIPEFSEQFIHEALKNIFSHFQIDKLHIIAESQAAPCVTEVIARETYIDSIQSLILLQPLGLNVAAFKGTPRERLHEFRLLVKRNFRYQVASLLFDRRLVHNHLQAYKIVGMDTEKSNAQYDKGLQANAVPTLHRLHQQSKVDAIICGANDMLFPASEIQNTLVRETIAIPVIKVPGVPHSPLAARAGRKLLQAAFDRLK